MGSWQERSDWLVLAGAKEPARIWVVDWQERSEWLVAGAKRLARIWVVDWQERSDWLVLAGAKRLARTVVPCSSSYHSSSYCF